MTFNTCYKASKNNLWNEAMNSKLEALYKNNTWDLAELLASRTAICDKWVYEKSSL